MCADQTYTLDIFSETSLSALFFSFLFFSFLNILRSLSVFIFRNHCVKPFVVVSSGYRRNWNSSCSDTRLTCGRQNWRPLITAKGRQDNFQPQKQSRTSQIWHAQYDQFISWTDLNANLFISSCLLLIITINTFKSLVWLVTTSALQHWHPHMLFYPCSKLYYLFYCLHI